MKKLTAIVLIICAFGFFKVSAQTNTVPPQLPASTAADWQKALSDIGVHVTAGTIMIILAIGIPLTKSLAGYARKIIPDTAQVNKAGVLLAHLAGEVNPSIPKLQAIADSTTQPTKP